MAAVDFPKLFHTSLGLLDCLWGKLFCIFLDGISSILPSRIAYHCSYGYYYFTTVKSTVRHVERGYSKLRKISNDSYKIYIISWTFNVQGKTSKTLTPNIEISKTPGDMTEVYKIINQLYAKNTTVIFGVTKDSITRGNKYKLQQNFCKYDLRQHFSQQKNCYFEQSV